MFLITTLPWDPQRLSDFIWEEKDSLTFCHVNNLIWINYFFWVIKQGSHHNMFNKIYSSLIVNTIPDFCICFSSLLLYHRAPQNLEALKEQHIVITYGSVSWLGSTELGPLAWGLSSGCSEMVAEARIIWRLDWAGHIRWLLDLQIWWLS